MLRLSIAFVCLFALIVVYVSNQFLTKRFTETISGRSEVRLALYVTNLTSELQRNSVVPQLLARDPGLILALETRDYTQTSAHLTSVAEEIGAASLLLLDRGGNVVAASDGGKVGEVHSDAAYFTAAHSAGVTAYTRVRDPDGTYAFVFSRRIDLAAGTFGVVVVKVSSALLEASWVGGTEAVLVVDSQGEIIMASEPVWRGLDEAGALRTDSGESLLDRFRRSLHGLAGLPADAYLRGEAVLRREARVPHQGWKMVSYTGYASVRERVNGILALEMMAFAILLAVMFWFMSRKTASRLLFFQRESAELRALNRRLQREIAERERSKKRCKLQNKQSRSRLNWQPWARCQQR